MAVGRGACSQLVSVWRAWVTVITPLILLPLPLLMPDKSPGSDPSDPAKPWKCAYVIVLMAVYWMTEAVPIAVTAFIPVALMPYLGVMETKELCKSYLKDTNMLFVGGLLLAVAVEKWNLHKRMALGVLLLVGSRPKWLMFGFMGTTSFLSMWLSNTATTAMMIPIVHAVLAELDGHRHRQRAAAHGVDGDDSAPLMEDSFRNGHTYSYDELSGTNRTEISLDDNPMSSSDLKNENDIQIKESEFMHDGAVSLSEIDILPSSLEDLDNEPVELSKEEQKEDTAFLEMSKGLTLCVAYAANVGGTATLMGTGPNLILKGQLDILFGGAGVTFFSWFVLAFPNMLLTLLLAWLWLQLLFLGPKTLMSCFFKRKAVDDSSAQAVIRREYDKLGPWSFAEVSTLSLFVLLALLWLFRDPKFMPGWSDLFKEGYVTDATVAMTVAVLLFMVPSRRPNILCFRRKSDTGPPGPVPALLDWPTVHEKMAWNVILVLGGGFALADACKSSGLSQIIGDAFTYFMGVEPWLLVLMLTVITAGFTEVASNTATATIFLPILAELAVTLSLNPLYLMLPVTIATSLAFMLPVATPPNAMVFAYGNMKIVDMARAGIVMNCLSIASLTLAINTWGFYYFNLGTVPPWSGGGQGNQTTTITILNTTSI